MRRLSPLVLVLTLTACADDPAPGALSPCDTSAGPLVSCDGPSVGPTPPTIEGACARLVECGLDVNNVDANGNHGGDYRECISVLRGNDYPIERLEFVLRCVEIASCDQIAAGHCLRFGGEGQ